MPIEEEGQGIAAGEDAVLIPVIELIEIGAGGGSIAHIDALGFLKVGPHSAGAQPGPAAYGRGGTQPTVTDADVVRHPLVARIVRAYARKDGDGNA